MTTDRLSFATEAGLSLPSDGRILLLGAPGDLVTEALGIADDTARSKVMAEIEKMLQRDAVIIQPYWRSLYRHVRPGVTGADIHPSWEIHLYKLGISQG